MFISSDGVFTTTISYEGEVPRWDGNEIENFDQYCIIKGGVFIDPNLTDAFINKRIYHIKDELVADKTQVSSLRFDNLQTLGGRSGSQKIQLLKKCVILNQRKRISKSIKLPLSNILCCSSKSGKNFSSPSELLSKMVFDSLQKWEGIL